MAVRPVVRPVASFVRRALWGLWRPAELFRNGEQGVWYDPSDLSTLYQDSVGTIPVTADGDPVGLMLDKSGNDNHATQSVAASRPVYRRGDSRGVVNLLKNTTSITPNWFRVGFSHDGDSFEAPDGTFTATRVTETGSSNNPQVIYVGDLSDGSAQTLQVYAKADSPVSIRFSTQVDVSGPLTTLDVGWKKVVVTQSANSSDGPVIGGFGSVVQGSGVSIYLWQPQLEQGTEATPYQRNDSHLGGVATGSADDLHWLFDDQIDDVMTATLPAMPTATVATATDDGVVVNYPVNIPAGAYSVDTTSTQGFNYGRVIVDRQLTASEQTALTAYLEGKS